jgi:hypothetical protein
MSLIDHVAVAVAVAVHDDDNDANRHFKPFGV